MVDLKALAQRLNEDAAFRAAFIQDPVAVFRDAGIVLDADNEASLRQIALKMKQSGKAVSGMHITVNIIAPNGGD